MRKPLMVLQGSIKTRLARSVRESMMKGNQDYSLNLGPTQGQLDYLQFMSAAVQKSNVDAEVVNLQQKIDHEVKMRDGTAKLLAACRGSNQAVEVAKNLLVSNARLGVYMEEMRRCKTEDKRMESEDVKPCKGTLTIKDLRIPLMWKDSDRFRTKDQRCYAAFCVLQVGSEIRETELITDANRLMTDLSFSSIAVFENVNPEFECHIEVYSHKIEACKSAGASTPQKIRRKFTDISLLVGRRLSGVRDESSILGNVLIGPKFDCIGRSTLKLSDVSASVASFDLSFSDLEVAGNSMPLFPHFCCHIAAQPNCFSQSSHAVSGWLAVGISHQQKSTFSRQPHKYWCRLEKKRLVGWKQAQHVDNINPAVVIQINENVKLSEITTVDSVQSAFNIQNTATPAVYALMHSDAAELARWQHALHQVVIDKLYWQQAYDSTPQIQSRFSTMSSSVLRRSSRRLSTANIHSTSDHSSPMTRFLNRLNDDELSSPFTGGRRTSSSKKSAYAVSSIILRSSKEIAPRPKDIYETDV